MNRINLFVLLMAFSVVGHAQIWKPAGNYSPNVGVVSSLYADSVSGNLIVGGTFDSIGNIAANNIAMWDGNEWHALDAGIPILNVNSYGYITTVFNGDIYAISAYNINDFHIYKWSGSSWMIFATADDFVLTIKTFNNKLYVGGDFYSIDGVTLKGIGYWDGGNWNSIGDGVDGEVRAIEFNSSGNLYLGGIFGTISGTTFNNIAMWDGTLWHQLVSGLISVGGGQAIINSLKFWNSNLYVGGDFNHAGSDSCLNIAKWNGTSWSNVGSGFNGIPVSLEVYNNELYEAGNYNISGTDTIYSIGKWTGSHWVDVAGALTSELFDIEVYNGELYTCGFGQISVNSIEKIARYSDLNFETQATSCTVCRGSATAIPVGLPPQTYLWGNGTTTQTITGLCAGTYSVTVTDSTGSQTSGHLTVLDMSPTIENDSTDASCYTCQDGSASITITGGLLPYSVVWNNGDTTNSIINQLPDTYYATIIDSGSCVVKDTLTISYNYLVQTQGQNLNCYNECIGSASVTTDGVAPLNYLWNNGSSSQTINNLCAGIYIITVTDSNGVIKKDTVVISQPNQILISISGTAASCPTCNNGTASINNTNGGTPPYSYLWNNGETTSLIDSLVHGVYTVTVTDSNICMLIDSVTVGFEDGVEQLTIDNGELVIYPNPVKGQLTIDHSPFTIHKIEITDMLGRVVLKQGVTPAEKKVELNISALSSGVYFIKVFSTQGAVTVRKVVKN